MMNPSLVGLLTDDRTRELRLVTRRSRALFSEGIIERRPAAARKLLSASLRKS